MQLHSDYFEKYYFYNADWKTSLYNYDIWLIQFQNYFISSKSYLSFQL